MKPDAQLRFSVYQEGQRAFRSGTTCPYTDWRAKTWEKGLAAAKAYFSETQREAPEPPTPGSWQPIDTAPRRGRNEDEVNDDDLKKIVDEAAEESEYGGLDSSTMYGEFALEVAKKVRERCVRAIEAYRVPVGNSAAGEMAAEWTMEALREIRDAIRGHNVRVQPATPATEV